MPVMDEFKEERAAMKNGTPKQKLSYFWDYYKWHVIGGCAALIALVSFVCQIVNRKDVAFTAMFINCTEREFMADSSVYTASFAEYAGIDETEYSIVYDSSVRLGGPDEYASTQKIMAYVAAADLDVMISAPDILNAYAYQGNFYDLRQFLSPEQLARYEDSLFYIDGETAEALHNARDAGDYDFMPDYGDPRHPETMQDPIPTGVFIKEDNPLSEYYLFPGDEAAVCVLFNTRRPELSAGFIDFLMQ